MHTILIADPQPLFREAMGRAISAPPPTPAYMHCQPEVMETDSLERTFRMIRAQRKLDLVLIDPFMPGMQGLASLLQLCASFPEVPVALIWDGQDRQLALQSMAFGAAGVISKTAASEQVNRAISHMLEGGIYLPPDILHSHPPHPLPNKGLPIVPAWLQRLSQRQLRVLERMALGESNKQIAWSLGIAETTVKTHVSMILQKLGVHNRVQAILMAKDVDIGACVGAHPTFFHPSSEPLHV